MNFCGDNNYIWIIIIMLCCCGGTNNCICDLLPLLLILECLGNGNGCGMGGGTKFGGCGCK